MTSIAEIASSAIGSYRKVLYNSVPECFLALEFRSRSERFRGKFRFRSDPKGLNSSLVSIFWCFVIKINALFKYLSRECLIMEPLRIEDLCY